MAPSLAGLDPDLYPLNHLQVATFWLPSHLSHHSFSKFPAKAPCTVPTPHALWFLRVLHSRPASLPLLVLSSRSPLGSRLRSAGLPPSCLKLTCPARELSASPQLLLLLAPCLGQGHHGPSRCLNQKLGIGALLPAPTSAYCWGPSLLLPTPAPTVSLLLDLTVCLDRSFGCPAPGSAVQCGLLTFSLPTTAVAGPWCSPLLTGYSSASPSLYRKHPVTGHSLCIWNTSGYSRCPAFAYIIWFPLLGMPFLPAQLRKQGSFGD